ncbi:hypothetical protein BBJ28_00026448, partial [Nothophytophthora sp. Chile5]
MENATPSTARANEEMPTLTCVAVVLRERPQVLALAHVVRQLTLFLDFSSRWTVERACDLPSLRLVRRILARDALEPPESLRRDPFVKQWQFSKGMTRAAAAGNVELAQGLVGLFPGCRVPFAAVDAAGESGHLPFLLWLHAQQRDLTYLGYRAVGMAIGGDHQEIARWLRGNTTLPLTQWVAHAAETDNLEMVKQILEVENDCGTIMAALSGAEYGGHEKIIAWVLENYSLPEGFKIHLYFAMVLGHLAFLRWMLMSYKEVCRYDRGTDAAAVNGHLGVLQWLHENALDSCTTYTMDRAAWTGHLDEVKWLHANRTEGCTHEAMDLAAERGFLDVV